MAEEIFNDSYNHLDYIYIDALLEIKAEAFTVLR